MQWRELIELSKESISQRMQSVQDLMFEHRDNEKYQNRATESYATFKEAIQKLDSLSKDPTLYVVIREEYDGDSGAESFVDAAFFSKEKAKEYMEQQYLKVAEEEDSEDVEVTFELEFCSLRDFDS